jgi:hypothetical protein
MIASPARSAVLTASGESCRSHAFCSGGYTVHRDLGGDAALARLRERLRKRGLRLMLDIVPNHTGPDHPWVEDHPSTTSPAPSGTWAGRPPTTSGSSARAESCSWPTGAIRTSRAGPTPCSSTTVNPATQEAMIGELVRIAGQCDGVRCDMAMLVLPDVFERTWSVTLAAVLAGGDPAGAGASAGLLLHGRGLLGPRVDAADRDSNDLAARGLYLDVARPGRRRCSR